LLLSIHAIVALKVPEAAINEEEAHKLAEATAKVASHYGTQLAIMSPKMQAWVELATVAGYHVYGPRIIAWRVRTAAERAERLRKAKERVNPTSGPVTPPGFNPPDPVTVDPAGVQLGPKPKGSQKQLSPDMAQLMVYTPMGEA
jgi:hypothetical protein